MMSLTDQISDCRLCAGRFAVTATAHAPRQVVWFRPGARLLIVGQAPGARVHASGKPFDDPSGQRLRDWMGIPPETFYDRDRIAIVPMARRVAVQGDFVEVMWASPASWEMAGRALVLAHRAACGVSPLSGFHRSLAPLG